MIKTLLNHIGIAQVKKELKNILWHGISKQVTDRTGSSSIHLGSINFGRIKIVDVWGLLTEKVRNYITHFESIERQSTPEEREKLAPYRLVSYEEYKGLRAYQVPEHLRFYMEHNTHLVRLLGHNLSTNEYQDYVQAIAEIQTDLKSFFFTRLPV
jgi:hypothetical protein